MSSLSALFLPESSVDSLQRFLSDHPVGTIAAGRILASDQLAKAPLLSRDHPLTDHHRQLTVEEMLPRDAILNRRPSLGSLPEATPSPDSSSHGQHSCHRQHTRQPSADQHPTTLNSRTKRKPSVSQFNVPLKDRKDQTAPDLATAVHPLVWEEHEIVEHTHAGDEQLPSLGSISEMKGKGKDKRKEQNRNAQRAFRERKEKRLQELQEQVDALIAKQEPLAVENKHLKELVAQLKAENQVYKQAFTFTLSSDLRRGAMPLATAFQPRPSANFNPSDSQPQSDPHPVNVLQSVSYPPLMNANNDEPQRRSAQESNVASGPRTSVSYNALGNPMTAPSKDSCVVSTASQLQHSQSARQSCGNEPQTPLQDSFKDTTPPLSAGSSLAGFLGHHHDSRNNSLACYVSGDGHIRNYNFGTSQADSHKSDDAKIGSGQSDPNSREKPSTTSTATSDQPLSATSSVGYETTARAAQHTFALPSLTFFPSPQSQSLNNTADPATIPTGPTSSSLCPSSTSGSLPGLFGSETEGFPDDPSLWGSSFLDSSLQFSDLMSGPRAKSDHMPEFGSLSSSDLFAARDPNQLRNDLLKAGVIASSEPSQNGLRFDDVTSGLDPEMEDYMGAFAPTTSGGSLAKPLPPSILHPASLAAPPVRSDRSSKVKGDSNGRRSQEPKSFADRPAPPRSSQWREPQKAHKPPDGAPQVQGFDAFMQGVGCSQTMNGLMNQGVISGEELDELCGLMKTKATCKEKAELWDEVVARRPDWRPVQAEFRRCAAQFEGIVLKKNAQRLSHQPSPPSSARHQNTTV